MTQRVAFIVDFEAPTEFQAPRGVLGPEGASILHAIADAMTPSAAARGGDVIQRGRRIGHWRLVLVDGG